MLQRRETALQPHLPRYLTFERCCGRGFSEMHSLPRQGQGIEHRARTALAYLLGNIPNPHVGHLDLVEFHAATHYFPYM